jgi:hypothetical protein
MDQTQISTFLRVTIANSEPVDLLDLARCLGALGNEYLRNAQRQGIAVRGEDVKLLVKEVRNGSIEIDLVQFALAASAVTAASNFNAICDFARNLKAGMEWLIEKKGDKPESMTSRASLKNYHDILEPVAKDKNGCLTIAPIQVNGPVQNLSLNVITVHANAGQNASDRELADMKEPTTAIREKVILHWYQTRNDPATKTGDMAIVECVTEDPVKTLFLGESTKAQMLSMEQNIFRKAFIVDLRVDTLRGKPKLYVIHAIHDAIDL